MVMALRTRHWEQKDFELKGFMMKKRNFLKGKTQGYTGELGLKIKKLLFPNNSAINASWYFLMHTEMIRKRTELLL